MDTPTPDLESIEMHVRQYRNLLKSTTEIKISQIIQSHIAMHSVLHEKSGEEAVDTAALIYSLLRLPRCMSKVKRVILAQSFTVFKNNGFAHIDAWEQVEAPGRRRKMYFDGKDTLAVYIGSVSDVDDFVTLLTAYQIEYNKLHELIVIHGKTILADSLPAEDIARLQTILGSDYDPFLGELNASLSITIRLLSGSYVEYMRATQYWWNHIDERLIAFNINERPIYFVSSNLHALSNLITRTAFQEKNNIIEYIKSSSNETLLQEWQAIEEGSPAINEEFFLNYAAKKYARHHPEFNSLLRENEERLGIHTVPAHHYLDITVQVIELKKLAEAVLPPTLFPEVKHLVKSDALIVNIDYPLGWAAYQILTEIGQNVDIIRGVYVMGKAAILAGDIGDITLPTTVFDLHTKNAYVFNNCFSATDFEPLFKRGSLFAHQKALTVKGTFLENRDFINHWYKEGYSTIEMEAGPYLNAIYECVYYNRYPENQFINLGNTPFEVGIAHYASDTPNSKAKNLGARNLSYEGVEATYSIASLILKKIIERELTFLAG